ncbi:hypothetical protein EPUL_001350 [Erysiphe pulchra]|uniref:Uncharacterized protein n=1 Tax=Erysiphe pulchra TaxID=225359 RepID=A0A2S4PZM6_9PEZI|nr:hypothetical protein EPUL_001350 [Erysiphe pulchra]
MLMEEYSVVDASDARLAENKNSLEEITSSISRLSLSSCQVTDSRTSSHNRIFINVEKEKTYLRDEGTLTYLLPQGLDDYDQALFTPKALWAYLQKKYNKPNKLAVAQFTKDINNFEFTQGITIADAWNRMTDLRRKVISAKLTAKTQYDDESLLLILTNALPEAYQSVIDDLNINTNLTIDDQLKHLENKEEKLRLAKDDVVLKFVSRKFSLPKTHEMMSWKTKVEVPVDREIER